MLTGDIRHINQGGARGNANQTPWEQYVSEETALVYDRSRTSLDRQQRI